jgi:enhancing lycopene biosynthesis protein 2
MTKVAVILSGCGYLDGSEIREAVITLLELDKQGAEAVCFAPNTQQADVINHLTGEPSNQTRNTLEESARIARGAVTPIENLKAEEFDALVIPGGYGAAKNLSTLATQGAECTVIPELNTILEGFVSQKKPIGAICIAPAVLVASLKNTISANVTIGDDQDNLITTLGGQHTACATNNIVTDTDHNIISCSAYMREDSLANVAQGIEKLIEQIIQLCEK